MHLHRGHRIRIVKILTFKVDLRDRSTFFFPFSFPSICLSYWYIMK